MRKHSYRSALFIGLCIYWLIPQAFVVAQTEKGDYPQIGQHEANKSGIFSGIFKNFQEKPVSRLVLDNSRMGSSNLRFPMRWLQRWKTTWI